MMAIALLVVLSQPATPQSLRRSRFEYDTSFVIGAYLVPGPASFARDTLKLDFTYHYAAPDVRTIDAPTHWKHTLDHDLYYQTDRGTARPLRTVFTPPVLKELHNWLSVTDSYAEPIADVQMFPFELSAGTPDRINIANDPDLLQTRSLPAATSGLLVGRPRYVTQYGFRRSDSVHYSVDTVYPFYDIGNGDPVKAVDSSYKVRFGFHMQVEENDTLQSSTVIAYVKLWRRLPLDGTCRCAAYERFDSVPLTYGMYTNANRLPEPLDQFKDVGFWIDMRDSTEFGVVVDNVKYRAIPGDWAGESSSDSVHRARCRDSLVAWRAAGRIAADTVLLEGAVEVSDIYYEFFTQGTAKIRFLRGRVAPHQFEALMNGRLARFLEPEIRDLLAPDPADPHFATRDSIRQRLWRIAMYDEPHTAAYPAHTFLTDTLLDLITHYSDSATWPGLFQDPVGNYDGFRRLQFDLDTARRTRVHMMSRQLLPMFDGPIPAYYARPDKMNRPGVDTSLWRRYYPTGPGGLVAPNSSSGYRRYTDSIQAELGRFRDYLSVSTHGRIIPTLARLVAVSKFKYADRVADSVPVYNVVTVNGAFNHNTDKHLKAGWLDGIRPKTPEEIAVQCFVSLNAGCQGINFDELRYDGVNLGIADYRYGTNRVDWTASSDTVAASTLDSVWRDCDRGEWDWANPPELDISAPRDTLKGTPHMWLGLRSRFLATQRVIAEIRSIAPVYERLYYRMEQMSVHDTLQSFDSMPMVAGLRMQRADTVIRDSIVALTTSDSVDARESTFAELSHFYPGSRDPAAVAANVRFVMVTNRRTHPIDHASYGSPTMALDPASNARGFGFIDVRRPLITLKNSTAVMADSFLVEKVGHEDSLHWGAKAGEELALDWLEPGWGGLYRITPITTPVSTYSTAYPNAVRSITIEGPMPAGPDFATSYRRVLVYERDSVIWLRAEHRTGGWTREWMVSDSADLDTLGASLAWNVHPTIATVVTPSVIDEDPRVFALVAWERHAYAPADTAHVVAKIFELDSLAASAPGRGVTLSPAFSLAVLDSLGIRMTPAAVGVPSRSIDSANTTAHRYDGGFAVAWAAPSKEIQVRFVNAYSGACSPIHVPSRNATILALTGDPTCSFPTLAYGRTRHWKHPDHDAVHLAFQQGTQAPGAPAARDHIVYSQMPLIRLSDSLDSAHAARSFAPSACEPVSSGIAGCTFEHPSIAADRARVGVAFEAQGTSRSVALRFRTGDTVSAPWRTTLYRWGAKDTVTSAGFPRFMPVFRDFTWPSLAHFASVPAPELLGMPLGAVAWQWAIGAPPIRNRQFLYRYGRASEQEIDRGQFAGLTVAPYVDSFAAAPSYSGVVYRGVDAASFSGTSIRGVPATYYPLYVRPIAGTSALQGVTGGRVVETFSLHARYMPDPCEPAMLGGGLVVDKPLLAPRFFMATELDTTIQSDLDDAGDVARTAVFTAADTALEITRIASGSAALLSWLETPAFNPKGEPPADVLMMLELVDDSTGAVLWRSDTVSARALGDAVQLDEVSVPVPAYASAGDRVYVRMAAVPSDSIDYHVTTEFMIVGDLLGEGTMSSLMESDDSTETELLKSTLRLKHRGAMAPGYDGAAAMALHMYPNPASETVRLTLVSRVAGTGVLRLVDELGRTVRAEAIELTEPGTYAMSRRVDGLPPGMYAFVVSVDGVVATGRFAVVR